MLSLRRTMTVYQRSITNGYLRSFSQLVSSVSRIDSAMQKEIYVVTPAMTSLLSAEIQSEAATAQAAMSALPYANIELAQTSRLSLPGGRLRLCPRSLRLRQRRP